MTKDLSTPSIQDQPDIPDLTEQELVKSFFTDRLTYQKALPKSTFHKHFPTKTSPILTQQIRDLLGRQYDRRVRRIGRNIKKWYGKGDQRVDLVLEKEDKVDLVHIVEVLSQIETNLNLELEQERKNLELDLNKFEMITRDIISNGDEEEQDLDRNIIPNDENVVELKEIERLLGILENLKRTKELE